MEVIHVYACPYDLDKLWKRMTSFRQSSFVRCQIAWDDVRKRTWPGEGTKIPAATQVGRGVELRWLAKVWIAARREFGSGVSAVATIAVALCVDDVAAEPYQCAVFSIQIQRDRGYLETNLNLWLVIIVIGVYAWGPNQYPRKNDHRKCNYQEKRRVAEFHGASRFF
jgi:hypothetical protein